MLIQHVLAALNFGRCRLTQHQKQHKHENKKDEGRLYAIDQPARLSLSEFCPKNSGFDCRLFNESHRSKQ